MLLYREMANELEEGSVIPGYIARVDAVDDIKASAHVAPKIVAKDTFHK
jgi:hypothetical protein